jgi:hypothetical protein
MRKIAGWDLQLTPTRTWGLLFLWWGLMLLPSVGLQIAGSQVATVQSEIFLVAVLLVMSLTRGYVVSGPGTWLIRGGRAGRHGAVLVGKMESRATG